MIPFLATIALLTFTPGNDLRETTAEPAAVSQNDGAKTAYAWQALLDAGDWEASWDKTAQSFQDLNTLGEWAQASQKARAPLGAMLTRTLVAQESVPAPPKGYLVVRFHTRFESREAIETVSLMRENGEWKIAGITIS